MNNTDNNLETPLTKREQQVFDLIMKGITYDDVATQLCISKKTVVTHVHSIFQKKFANSLPKLMADYYQKKISDFKKRIEKGIKQ